MEHFVIPCGIRCADLMVLLSFFTQICTLAVRESLANVRIIHLLSVKLWFVTNTVSLLHRDNIKAVDFLLYFCLILETGIR